MICNVCHSLYILVYIYSKAKENKDEFIVTKHTPKHKNSMQSIIQAIYP